MPAQTYPGAAREATRLQQTNGEGVFCVSGNTWTQQLIKAFKSDSYLSNPDAVRALAYTNKRVEKINEIVRDEIRGNDAPRFVIGERLIAKNHYYLPNSYGAAQKVFSVRPMKWKC